MRMPHSRLDSMARPHGLPGRRPESIVERVRPAALESEVSEHVDRLLGAYPAGTVTVIAPDPTTVMRGLDLGSPPVA
jgi:hypothetical protein